MKKPQYLLSWFTLYNCYENYLFLGLDYDEAFEEGDEEDMIHEQVDLPPAFSSSTPIATTNSPAKPILKSAEKETPLPRKSVRFSLRPGGINIQKQPSSVRVINIKPETSNEIITSDLVNQSDVDISNVDDIAAVLPTTNEPIKITPEHPGNPHPDLEHLMATVKSPPKKRKTDSDAMDKAVEEFSKAVEQEEKESLQSSSETSPNMSKTTRRGRVIHPPNLESPSG